MRRQEDPKQQKMFPSLVVGKIELGKSDTKRRHAMGQYKTLDPAFLKLMDDIGIYGMEKYGKESFEIKRQEGRLERTMERVQSAVIADHANEHFQMAIKGMKHDHFGTVRHNLAAAAFNAYMEWAYQAED